MKKQILLASLLAMSLTLVGCNESQNTSTADNKELKKVQAELAECKKTVGVAQEIIGLEDMSQEEIDREKEFIDLVFENDDLQIELKECKAKLKN